MDHSTLPVERDCLYVAQLANGVLKVGFTRFPRHRMKTLSSIARTRLATEVVGCALSRPFGERHLLRVAETVMFSCLERIGTPDIERNEYFHGVSFAVAEVLMEQVAMRYEAVGQWLQLAHAKKQRVGNVAALGSSVRVISHGPSICPREPSNANQLCR